MADAREIAELNAALRKWRRFEECVLHEIRSTDAFFTLDLIFDYIWNDEGRVRDGLGDDLSLVKVTASVIKELTFEDGFSEAMRRWPEQVNWGIAEVAEVSISSDGLNLRLIVSWENDRRIEIVCGSIEVGEVFETDDNDIDISRQDL